VNRTRRCDAAHFAAYRRLRRRIIVPFVGIKLIDMLLVLLGLA
jgi:hypothetical protein